jgi:two-component system response regulator AtoC
MDAPAPGAAKILVVEDDNLIRHSVVARLKREGHDAIGASSIEEATNLLDDSSPDLALLDQRLPDGDGLVLLPKIREHHPETTVIMMTGFGGVEMAVDAMKRGAFHFVTKPVELTQLVALVDKGLEHRRLRREVSLLREQGLQRQGSRAIIGESEPMQVVKSFISKVAQSPAKTVLVTGESGTGKDLVARAIHQDSDRPGRLVNITCSAIPDALLESELFGYEKGAFTDARTRKIGLIEDADDGTLFLDEIGEMSLGLQSKLLRFLEERRFRRIGGNKDIEVDVRVVAATNRRLEEESAEGRFRADLMYRLRVLEIVVPPLRTRGGDTRLLAKFFCERLARDFGSRVEGISAPALELLEAQTWPGNVRELKNAIERAVLLSESIMLQPDDFPLVGGGNTGSYPILLPPGGIDIEAVEIGFVMQALSRTDHNRTRAGALLGLNRDQIRYRVEKYNLEGTSSVEDPDAVEEATDDTTGTKPLASAATV